MPSRMSPFSDLRNTHLGISYWSRPLPLEFKGLVINYWEGGLKNGKIVCPKPFAPSPPPPPQDMVKLFAPPPPPLVKIQNILCPPPLQFFKLLCLSFNMAKTFSVPPFRSSKTSHTPPAPPLPFCTPPPPSQ